MNVDRACSRLTNYETQYLNSYSSNDCISYQSALTAKCQFWLQPLHFPCNNQPTRVHSHVLLHVEVESFCSWSSQIWSFRMTNHEHISCAPFPCISPPSPAATLSKSDLSLCHGALQSTDLHWVAIFTRLFSHLTRRSELQTQFTHGDYQQQRRDCIFEAEKWPSKNVVRILRCFWSCSGQTFSTFYRCSNVLSGCFTSGFATLRRQSW